MQTMSAMGKRYGCGRAMWEYSASENRFGTPEALMLLPFETDGCIDSMEGLLFESSATTPYHFLNQAELSAGPSEPEVGLPYGPLNVTLGVKHLQLLGVKYFMAETPQVEQEAAADPGLQLIAKTRSVDVRLRRRQATTTWQIYLVKDSSLVTPLANDPVGPLGSEARAGELARQRRARGTGPEPGTPTRRSGTSSSRRAARRIGPGPRWGTSTRPSHPRRRPRSPP